MLPRRYHKDDITIEDANALNEYMRSYKISRLRKVNHFWEHTRHYDATPVGLELVKEQPSGYGSYTEKVCVGAKVWTIQQFREDYNKLVGRVEQAIAQRIIAQEQAAKRQEFIDHFHHGKR